MIATSNGYEFLLASDLFETVAQPPFIVLGHDVDRSIDINNIRHMMEIEREAGMRSTWYFRLHAEYNLLFFKTYELIQLLLKGGNEVGIHFDTDFYTLFQSENEEDRIAQEVRIFKWVIGEKPKVANVHNKDGSANGGAIFEDPLKRFGLYFADHTVLRKMGITYISDSDNAWRERCLCTLIERGEPRIYATIHPSWWQRRSSCENY